LFCGGAAKMWFYAAAKIFFHAAKPHVEKQLRHSRKKKVYTKVHFGTTLELFYRVFSCLYDLINQIVRVLLYHTKYFFSKFQNFQIMPENLPELRRYSIVIHSSAIIFRRYKYLFRIIHTFHRDGLPHYQYINVENEKRLSFSMKLNEYTSFVCFYFCGKNNAEMRANVFLCGKAACTKAVAATKMPQSIF
jgi:hypothetical protein